MHSQQNIKICIENQNTQLIFSNFCLENRAIYEIIRTKNIVELGRSQMTIRRRRFACWIPKATDKHAEYVMFIACPQQQ